MVNRNYILLVFTGLMLLSFIGSPLYPQKEVNKGIPIELSLRKETEHSIQKGLAWLEKRQGEDGSWSSYPAITALVVTAFLNSPFASDYSFTIERGVQYILDQVKPDGGIYGRDMPCYNTSICIMALLATGDAKYAEVIRRARDFLITLQADDEEGYTRRDRFYGGIGYGGDERPDMSNMQWALEALKKSEPYRVRSEATGKQKEFSGTQPGGEIEGSVGANANKELFWDKAIVFLERCQNLKKYNDQPESLDDGGFVYYPGYSQAGGLRSYGSMTYAGLKSFIYADVGKDDPRVQAAYKWIKNHFTLEENPPMGDQGLYYYYHTMAKALSIYGEDVLTDDKGIEHNWRSEFISKLIKIQNGDGSWVNSNGRWWENNKDLVTAYSILALEETLSVNK